MRDGLRRSALRVMDWFRKADGDGSGTVDRYEFRDVIQQSMGIDDRPLLDALFDSMDTDGNGVLDRDEIKAAFSGLMGRRLSDDDVNLMLDMFHHEQGNEEVDTVEFEHLVRYHLFVPCTDTCYVCDPSKRAVVGAQTRRPLSAQQQRCKNFSVCGFQGPVRIVGTQ